MRINVVFFAFDRVSTDDSLNIVIMKTSNFETSIAATDYFSSAY